jgi:hypothetical protein
MLRTIESSRFVTGVTCELWHGTGGNKSHPPANRPASRLR